jgi:hypothetical protein
MKDMQSFGYFVVSLGLKKMLVDLNSTYNAMIVSSQIPRKTRLREQQDLCDKLKTLAISYLTINVWRKRWLLKINLQI